MRWTAIHDRRSSHVFPCLLTHRHIKGVHYDWYSCTPFVYGEEKGNGNKEAHTFKYNDLAELDNFAILDGGLYLRAEAVKLEGESTNYNGENKTVTVVDGEQKYTKHLNTEG